MKKSSTRSLDIITSSPVCVTLSSTLSTATTFDTYHRH
jgi:hypothetical protein